MNIDDLNHSQMIRLRSPDKKGMTLAIGAFNGNMRFGIFQFDQNSKSGSSVLNLKFSRFFIQTTIHIWKKLLKENKPGSSVTIGVTLWDTNQKTRVEKILITYGFKEDKVPFIAIKDIDKDVTYNFILEKDNTYNFNRTQMDVSELNEIIILNFISALSVDIPVASRLTSYSAKAMKEQFDSRRGGNGNSNSSGGGYDSGSGYDETFN